MKKYSNFFIPLIVSILIIFVFLLSNNYTHSSSYTSSLDYNDDVTFLVTSDIHYLSSELTDYGSAFNKFIESGDGKQTQYISAVFDEFIKDIEMQKPDFLIISGDLTLNGEKKSHIELSNKLAKLKNSGIQTYVIPGNHDINNPWARQFKEDKQFKTDFISKEDFLSIYNDFGYCNALSRDSASLSYLVSPTNSIYLLMLDDNLYDNNQIIKYPEASGYISSETLEWIDSCGRLARHNNAKIIAVTHHTILNHSDYVTNGFTIENNDEVLKCFKKNNIKICLSGHVHFNSIKDTKIKGYPIINIASSSLSAYPNKFGIVNISNNKHLSYSADTVSMKNYDVDFKDNSRLYYLNFIYNQNLNSLSYDDSYSKDEVKLMCKTICEIRLKYDDSLDEKSWDDITSSDGFNLLKTCTSPFIKHYVSIALQGNSLDNNTLNMNL